MDGMSMGSSMNMDAMSSASKTVASSMASMNMDTMSSASKILTSSMASMSMDAMTSASKTLASSMASMSMNVMSSASKTLTSSMASMSTDAMSSTSKTLVSSMASMAGMSMSSSSATMSSASAQATSDSSMSDMSGMSGMSGMSSSSNSSSSGMDMDMDMDMGMNYYLTPTYKNYPVLFHHLHANNSGKAFGIFLLLVVAAFVYKLLLFVSWCLEVHWFKKWDKKNKYCTLSSANDEDDVKNYGTQNNFEIQGLPKLPNLLGEIFVPSLMDLFHDIIRAFLVFTSTMIIYMLMLATMSFVLTYVFAVITGLALSEVFFNRCKLAMLKRWDIQREIQKTKNCPGFGNCQCGRHSELTPDRIAVADTTSASDQSTRLEKNNGSNVAITDNNQTTPPAQKEGCILCQSLEEKPRKHRA